MSNSSRFSPDPSDSLVLFGEEFRVRAHPGAPGTALAAEGGRGTVFGLTRQRDQLNFALKVLKRRYRGPQVIAANEKLRALQDLPGFSAAARRVVPESDPAAVRCADLKFAILIPWLAGTTFFDLLLEAQTAGWRLERGVAIAWCHQFLQSMAALESRGAAHTDISPGNVMIDRATRQVAMLDLEDMYLPGADRPIDPSAGTDGYRHRSMGIGVDLWLPAGDRYAAAILAAEMLILAAPDLARQATDKGFFQNHHSSAEGRHRFTLAEPWLDLIAPAFLASFRQTWYSSRLEDCPTLGQLSAAIGQSRLQVPGFAGWVAWDSPPQVAPAAAAAEPRPETVAARVTVAPAESGALAVGCSGALIGFGVGAVVGLATGLPIGYWVLLAILIGIVSGAAAKEQEKKIRVGRPRSPSGNRP